MGKQFTQEQFKKAIPGSGGIIATIAKRVGCSWHTAHTYIHNNPAIARMYEDEANTIDDFAESVVINSMKRNDVASAKWWLERRRRGKYATKVETEVSGKDGGPIRITTIEVVHHQADNDPATSRDT